MLTHIHIRDLITIESLELDLDNHCTMITGETGSGKSIIIEAIQMALGGRASSQLIRPGKDKAEISLCFDITQFPHVQERMETLSLDKDQSQLIIRRVLTADGRSRSSINGTPVTLPTVKEFGEMLFHLHSQHEQQILLLTDTQRIMLDRYGNHDALLQNVSELAQAIKSTDTKIDELSQANEDRYSKISFLQYQLEELSRAELKQDEWLNLEKEQKQLSNRDELIKHIQEASACLHHDTGVTILSALNQTKKILESIVSLEPKAITWLETLESAHISLDDLAADLTHYLDRIELNADQLEKIEARMSELYHLARKYKLTPNELPQYETKLHDELNLLNNHDDVISSLMEKRNQLLKDYQSKATQLYESRIKASKSLAAFITTTIRTLALPHAEFTIQLGHQPELISVTGTEKIIFQIKTNPDQTMLPLNKAISGGELSRLSLTLHLALAHQTSIPTLVFDEVDTGLSGATAEKIGKLLRQLGESYQVFCITHQAQVAAQGHHHLLVEKEFIDQITHTKLRILNANEKKREIARLLSGEVITEKTLAHADEMLLVASSTI